MFGKIVRHMLRRQGTSILRSLARTAASSGDRGESSGTGGGLRGRPRGFAAALSAAAAPPSPQAGWDAFAGRPPLFTAPELLPTQSSRRRMPSLPAALYVRMLRSLPGKNTINSRFQWHTIEIHRLCTSCTPNCCQCTLQHQFHNGSRITQKLENFLHKCSNRNHKLEKTGPTGVP